MENIIKDNIPLMEESERKHFDLVLSVALDVASGLLKNGASVSRAENTVERICYALGAEEVNVFSFPSIIEVSVKISDGSEVSQMKRVYGSSNNFGKLEMLNQLSRDICSKKCTLEEAHEKSKNINSSPCYKLPLVVAGGGVAAGSYAVFYGGSLLDFIPAALIGALMVYLNILLSRREFNGYARTFILSLIGGFLSILFCWIYTLCGVDSSCSMVMIGTIMVVIPGLLVCNAVRDMFVGDIFSGSFELLNGIITTLAIVAGYGVALFFLQPIVDMTAVVPRESWESYTYSVCSCLVGAVGFAVMFNIPFKQIAIQIADIVVTYAIYLVMNYYLGHGQLFVNILTVTVFAALIAEILARVCKAPSTIFLVPPIIVFIPGGALYYAFSYLIAGNLSLAQSWGLDAGITVLGLAVGISVVTALFQLVYPVKGRVAMAKLKQPKRKKRNKFFNFSKKNKG